MHQRAIGKVFIFLLQLLSDFPNGVVLGIGREHLRVSLALVQLLEHIFALLVAWAAELFQVTAESGRQQFLLQAWELLENNI
jgi:hypothetical protein